MLLGLIVYSAKTGPWQDKIFWMLLILGYFVFPNEGSGGAHLNERFLPFAWVFLPVGIALQGAKLRYAQYLSVATSHPRELIQRWIQCFGEEQATAVCRHGLQTPPIIVVLEDGVHRQASSHPQSS